MEQADKDKDVVYRDKSAKVSKTQDGQYRVEVDVTKDMAAKFYEACNLVSKELGRPVSKEEALNHMLTKALKRPKKK